MAIEKDITIKCTNEKYSGVKDMAQLMAYIKDDHHSHEKVTLGRVLDYTKDYSKTILETKYIGKHVLVSSIREGVECRELDEYDFIGDKERYKKYKAGDRRGYGRVDKGQANERDAYHVIQSFPGKEHGVELDPRIAHQIGVEYAKKAFPGYKVVVTTHLNTDHIHNHIAVCAYNEDGRHKLNFDKAFRRSIRKINDEISMEYNLPILEEHTMYRSRNTELDDQRIRAKHGHTMKDVVRTDIDSVLAEHGTEFKSFDGFVRYLEKNLDYEVVQTANKVTFTKKSLLMKNGKSFKVKDSTLGDEYTRRFICDKYNYPEWYGTDRKGRMVPEQEQYSSEKEERINRFLETLRDENDDHIIFNTDIKDNYRPKTIRVSRYTDNGRRRSNFEIIIMTVIEVFKYILDRLFHANNGLESSETHNVKELINGYEKALAIVQKYNIETESDLKCMKIDLTRTQSRLQAEKDFRDQKIEFDSITLNTIREFKELSDKLLDSGIRLSDDILFVHRPQKEELVQYDRQNMPITGRQKRIIHHLLNKGDQQYTLKSSFDELSNKEAIDVIRFLSGGSTVKPDIVADPAEQKEYKQKKLCERRFDNIEKYKEDHFSQPISKALAGKLNGYIKTDGLNIDPYKLLQGQGLGLLQHYKEIPLTDDRTINKTQVEAINRRLAQMGLQLNKPTEYVLRSEYDQLKSYLDSERGKTPEALTEFTPMSVCTKERIKGALSVSGRELAIPMEYISENTAKILESDLLYKAFVPAALKEVNREKKALSPEQIEKVNKEREPEFYASIGHYSKEIQNMLVEARGYMIDLYSRGADIDSEDRITGDLSHGRWVSEQLRKELLETEGGLTDMSFLFSVIEKAMEIIGDPDRYIEADYGRFLEKKPEIQPERETERTDNRNKYFAEDEEIDDEPEEESRKPSAWDMYYGLGH